MHSGTVETTNVPIALRSDGKARRSGELRIKDDEIRLPPTITAKDGKLIPVRVLAPDVT